MAIGETLNKSQSTSYDIHDDRRNLKKNVSKVVMINNVTQGVIIDMTI